MSSQELFLRLLTAVLVGGAIGYEREKKNCPAGLRTHILVCIGSAVISMITVFSQESVINLTANNPSLSSVVRIDVARFGAQVISGVGFLGAGTIIHQKGSIKGLTTAASLWVVSCIGLAVGFGYYRLILVSTLFVVVVLFSMKKLEDKLLNKYTKLNLSLSLINHQNAISSLTEYFEARNIKIKHIGFIDDNGFSISSPSNENIERNIAISLMVPSYIKPLHLVKDIAKIDNIKSVTIQ